MQYVRVSRYVEGGRAKGFELDADRYLAQLPVLAPSLPDGARNFATDPNHYDFFSTRCVKDLELESPPEADDGALCLVFKPSPWKHEIGLRVAYRGVTTWDFTPSSGTEDFGSVLLDELLPSERGATHEIFMTGGTLYIDAEDLEATWTD